VSRWGAVTGKQEQGTYHFSSSRISSLVWFRVRDEIDRGATDHEEGTDLEGLPSMLTARAAAAVARENDDIVIVLVVVSCRCFQIAVLCLQFVEKYRRSGFRCSKLNEKFGSK
jgi:hypothetical protein